MLVRWTLQRISYTYRIAGDRGGVGGSSLIGSAVIVTCEVIPARSVSAVRGRIVTSVLLVMKDVGPSVWT